MIYSTKRLVLGSLLATAVIMTTGCNKGPTRPPIEEAAIVGDWIEVVKEASTSARVAPTGEKKTLRHLTLNADKTFTFSLRTKSGKPLKGDFKCEGTWSINAELIQLEFKVSNSTFPENDERRDWAPETSLGLTKRDVAGSGITEVMIAEDLMGSPTTYMRAQ